MFSARFLIGIPQKYSENQSFFCKWLEICSCFYIHVKFPLHERILFKNKYKKKRRRRPSRVEAVGKNVRVLVFAFFCEIWMNKEG
ncbi:MAG: hypothetical protein C4520_04270 [Candidatus Abyssobacteria bacterium SURF_5]|uniref:Uncharacterized protein n=1 Tax=Abyssobacteria bacterium (strain SURF_5) TaxID=2093360 RepID=A0A3A4P0I2_ABYX5|nr:MAG: hypothetical protein C4520_04270 [Candidatus Abyssubacteria bacterium SURF_5]